ncbi:MAG: twin-arginine translocase subunit TatC [Nevskiaceae bacterium]|nr:MAG: twin-arginine translocase subunit TatC [Nevskiaceae bacterium]TBR71633.1 MAG: twin-arginine translocase subunit TatC [Nevskiaceae bacterium]
MAEESLPGATPPPDDEPDAGGPEQPLLTHLLELRKRLLRAALGYLVVLVPVAVFARPIYHFLAEPLMRLLPPNSTMIATQVASPFVTPLKLAATLSLVLALPWVLAQIWAFVAPGLYRNERRLVAPLLLSSTLLFYAGIAFAYYLVLPHVFQFFINFAPQGVSVMTDINEYLSFVLKLFVAFGITFETPVAIVLLCWTGFTSVEQLKKSRSYVVVGVFVVGAVIAPPDVLSQILLAGCMYGLFEFGILWASWVVRHKHDENPEDDEAATP